MRARVRGPLILVLVLVLALVATLGGVVTMAARDRPQSTASADGHDEGLLDQLGKAARNLVDGGSRGRTEPVTAGLAVHEKALPGKVWPAQKRVREITDRRTATSRVYQLSDGRLQAEISAAPLHYRDAKGRWQSIDTRVRPTGRDGYVQGNTTNSFTSLFGNSSDDLVRFEQQGRSVELGLVGAAKGVTPRVAGSTVTYPGVAGGADVVYDVTATAVKEKIVLHRPPAPLAFKVQRGSGDMQLQIRLLGTVELSVDGQSVKAGGAKQRATLAALALEANRPVPLDRLARMVWGDFPPASAVANLRSHISALRQALGERIIARSHAYELRLAGLDVTEFQRLAGEGRASLASADPVTAVRQLTEALALWRGPAGSGLPTGTALDNRWATLEEQRLQVFEELTQARLDLGEHADLLAGLRQHLAAHPLRERAWAQLMLALYRCGDTTAALTTYRDARSILDEQLGLEPGEELVALHRAMLDRSPDLTVPAGAMPAPTGESPPVGRGAPVPRELPADLVTFVARTAEVAAVVAAVTGGTPAAVVVSGPVGYGKSALAVRAAHTVAADFPDGQVFVDLGYRPTVGAEEVLGRVLRALGVPPADVKECADERVGRFRSLVADRRILLVVDGVTRAAQVRPLVPAGPGPALIVAGQRHLPSLDGVPQVTVDGLLPDEARTLLGALVGRDRLDDDPQATTGLLRICAGSPLAVRIVGSRLTGRPESPVRALVERLRDGRHRLDWLACDDLSVRERLATACAAVRAGDEVAGRIVEMLGGAPDEPAVPDGAAAQLGVSPARARRALEELVETHLASRAGSDGYRLPALVREYAVEVATVPGQRRRDRRGEPGLALPVAAARCRTQPTPIEG
ncbi:AfsR/SARP family transcriptional regulator [Micromonospora inyonensis]|uniref:DNA-binding transcriptional activator of the SARP family n=1 Tax=Micromonospora inyonensis TaxID=47866 RepID=A0A1C6S5R9_9ACTN|nr:BTAD domain-containing putative transcriptional regulator [Micromonospora inyonensis]SCL24616.1 DNA-binding transcriptional activator of the SARP family [Micromonospora inyonensis]